MVYETFSKRNLRIANEGKTEIYQYDNLPHPFRVQVVHIWHDALGKYYIPGDYSSGHPYASNKFWDEIHDTLAREAGLPHLGRVNREARQRCIDYVLQAPTEDALNIIELSFAVIDAVVRPNFRFLSRECRVVLHSDDAIIELNHRFKEHAIGYQYANGILFKMDSQFLHAAIVKPALTLLNAKGFEGPLQEFVDAFDHFRHGQNKEASDAALKSFESTMKAICTKRNWTYDSKATAKPLLDILIKNGLIPASMESHFTGLRVAMESGLPTIRNTSSGHGQGPVPRELPEHVAAHALHLLAANVVLLIEADKALK
jgi:AbiJ N-terminal domain 4